MNDYNYSNKKYKNFLKKEYSKVILQYKILKKHKFKIKQGDFFFFGDAGDGLIDDFEFFEGLGGGVKLAEAAIDENQAGQRLAIFLQGAIAALDRFAHAGEIVAQDAERFF